METVLFHRALLVAASIAGTSAALGTACALDRFGELAVTDAGRGPIPSANAVPGADANPIASPSMTSAPPGDDGPRVGDSLVPASDVPGTPDATWIDASASADDSDAPFGTCNFDGTWASRLTIDVNWVPQGIMGVILAPGSGQIKQWILANRVTNGGAATDITVVCGIALPDFAGTQFAGGETYGVEFSSSTFDSGVLGSFLVQGTIAGPGPGATYSSGPTAVLLGLTLANPTTDPWPTMITTEVDSDRDGKPGMTGLLSNGPGYWDVPVDTAGNRADELYVSMRQVTEVSATALDCDVFTGTVTIAQVPDSTGTLKYAIDSHVIGCRLDSDAGDCNALQAAFVDTTQPVFSPSGSTTFTSVRVPAGTTCGTVRQRLP